MSYLKRGETLRQQHSVTTVRLDSSPNSLTAAGPRPWAGAGRGAPRELRALGEEHPPPSGAGDRLLHGVLLAYPAVQLPAPHAEEVAAAVQVRDRRAAVQLADDRRAALGLREDPHRGVALGLPQRDLGPRPVVVEQRRPEPDLCHGVPLAQIIEANAAPLFSSPPSRTLLLQAARNGGCRVRIAEQVDHEGDAGSEVRGVPETPEGHGKAIHAIGSEVRGHRRVPVVSLHRIVLAVRPHAPRSDGCAYGQLLLLPVPVLLLGAGGPALEQRLEPVEGGACPGHAAQRPQGVGLSDHGQEATGDLVDKGPWLGAQGAAALPRGDRAREEEGHKAAAGGRLAPGVRRAALQHRRIHRLVLAHMVGYGHRGKPHNRSVACVVGRGAVDARHRAGGAGGPIRQFLDLDEGLGDVAAEAHRAPDGPLAVMAEGVAVAVRPPHVPAATRVPAMVALVHQQRVGQAQRHAAIVGPLARLQEEPVVGAMVLQLALMDAGQEARPLCVGVARAGAVRQLLVHGHKLQGVAHGVADGEAKHGAHGRTAAAVGLRQLRQQAPPVLAGGQRLRERRLLDEFGILAVASKANGRRAVQRTKQLCSPGGAVAAGRR
eukprot:CAMPEP_0168376534 /NCGR_PEP_ID=MMETSP0228-20121227/10367_1 /TAXON_ID=133427 /ORGANISM="Protoceratium reticulatum, Strain CCCM 535 (=CCMP 1889)" /LENGTH=602 /DNA_ID=CAMNT_0008389517 /DNA_START=151 /DNA_END=1961 /DNA_ORIENTATION=-